MSPSLSQDWQLRDYGNEGNATSEGEKRLCNPQCRTDGVSFLLLLMLLKKFFRVIYAYKMFLYIYIFYCCQNVYGFSRLALALRMWSVLVFRSAKGW